MKIKFVKRYQNVPEGHEMHVPNTLGQQWIDEGYAEKIDLNGNKNKAIRVGTDINNSGGSQKPSKSKK